MGKTRSMPSTYMPCQSLVILPCNKLAKGGHGDANVKTQKLSPFTEFSTSTSMSERGQAVSDECQSYCPG